MAAGSGAVLTVVVFIALVFVRRRRRD